MISLITTAPPPVIYRSAIMHMTDRETLVFYQDGGLIINEDGNIACCNSWEALASKIQQHYRTYPVIQLPPEALIIPGLIDLHTHLPQWDAIGWQAPTLTDWLDTAIFPVEMAFSEASYVSRITTIFLKQLLANGTTTAALFLTSHPEATTQVFKTATHIGNRLIMGQNLMDCNAPSALIQPAETLLAQTEVLYQQWDNAAGGRLKYAWMPRFALTSSETLLEGIGQLCKRYPKVYCHTHLSEQLSEIEAVLKQFPWANTYCDVYDRFGLLHQRSLLAHGIHLGKAEFSRLKETRSKLIHCPTSNFFLKSGEFKAEYIETCNIPYALGSDVAAGSELSLFQVMKSAQYRQTQFWFSPQQLFYAATLGGASALEMDDQLGNLANGKSADFIILNLDNKPGLISALTVENPEKLLSKLIYLGDDRLVVASIIQGQCCYFAGHS
jgi:guanine deaminase